MKVLVTGAAGMVGSHVVEQFAALGYDVIAFDNLQRSQLFGATHDSVEHTWSIMASWDRVHRVVGDIRDRKLLAQLMDEDLSLVVHAAAQPGVGWSINDPVEDCEINTLGTLHVLEAVRQHAPQAAVIYCSTNKVYGENVSGIPIKEDGQRYRFCGHEAIAEDMPVDQTGHTPYGVSKYAGDLYVQEYAHLYGLKTAVFRMSCIYGSRQFGFEDQGWVAHFGIAAVLGRPVTIYGDGKQVRDVLFVSDLVEAFRCFVDSPLRHGVFNIGGGVDHTLSLLELVDRLEARLGQRLDVRYADWRTSDQRVYITDIAKVQRALAWSPHTTIDEGLDTLLDWIHSHRELFTADQAGELSTR